ncbi:MAG: hydrogenase expression/formation protein HypE [Bacteroidales bacterium]|nr:hydrogenase expression/formation protein HypE [Bacteroidales bacterium]
MAIQEQKVLLAHGSGGKLSSALVKKYFIDKFSNPVLDQVTDSAILKADSSYIAFTTDSYVIDPVFFPGGDIGKLAVCGTVNDLAVAGASPRFLSAAFVIEEGFPLSHLEMITNSMAQTSGQAGVKIVTGDTKVVNRGKCDKIFITTTGIGVLNPRYRHISRGENIKTGDAVIINGSIGDHAIAVLGVRENIRFEEELFSDCAPLNTLIDELLEAGVGIKFMRDLTRGGLGTILAEVTENKTYGICIEEKQIPLKDVVKGACEIFGFDPLYLANEGKVMIVTDKNDAVKALSIMKKNLYGKNAMIIGEITKDFRGKAALNSVTGGKRIIDKLTGEMLPRIC